METLPRLKPLNVMLNPANWMEGFPGESVTLHVSLINQGNQGALIDVLISSSAQELLQWCSSPRKRVALEPQQACEVSLSFEIPIETLPGRYPYTVIVDAPDHYPEATPIHHSGALEVSVKERAVVDPPKLTFSSFPATSPDQPLWIVPSQPQILSVTVKNQSRRVDRFRLSCLDLDETWFTIRYPANGLSEIGLVSSLDGLELNPGDQGNILVDFHYPVEMPAGRYTPTLQLTSDNASEQIYLDLVYLEIKPKLQISVELETILGKVSRSPGQYRLLLKNHGNSIRELEVSASSRDESESCDYVCEPSFVSLLIGEIAFIDLTIRPTQKWRRPLFGHGLELPFQIHLQDRQALPTPDKLPLGTLIWKARPWWQVLLWVLAGVGTLAGIGFLAWFLFFRPAPLPVLETFEPDSTSYTEGGRVRLSWTIANADQLEQITLSSSSDQTAISPQTYDFRQGIPAELDRSCQLRYKSLTCTNIDTGARLVGKYIFKLQLQPKSNRQGLQQNLEVIIKPKPLPQVVVLGMRQTQLEKGKSLMLGWTIQNFSQLDQLQVIGQLKGAQPTLLKTYRFQQQESQRQIPSDLENQCQLSTTADLQCSNIAIGLPEKPGEYTVKLQPVSAGSQTQSPPSKPLQVQVKAAPLKILTFTLNGQSAEDSPSFFLKTGEGVDLDWQVQGDGVKVTLDPLGNVLTSGSRKLKATKGLSQITLTATNDQDQSEKRSFLVQVDDPAFVQKTPRILPQPKSKSSR